MNIKGVIPQTIPVDGRLKAERVGTPSKYQEAADRDADGRRQDSHEEARRHLSDEEFQAALDILKNLPGLVANHLVVRVETHEDHRVVFIEDPGGVVVRRLSESELWLAVKDKDRSTGRILDKAG